VQTFASARDAKEFIVSRITTEAQRQGVPLSEIERKMLYFSETEWTLPDMAEVNDAFDREYDQAAYERKIGKIIEARAPTPVLITEKSLSPGLRRCALLVERITI
jgi:hypothetical protein